MIRLLALMSFISVLENMIALQDYNIQSYGVHYQPSNGAKHNFGLRVNSRFQAGEPINLFEHHTNNIPVLKPLRRQEHHSQHHNYNIQGSIHNAMIALKHAAIARRHKPPFNRVSVSMNGSTDVSSSNQAASRRTRDISNGALDRVRRSIIAFINVNNCCPPTTLSPVKSIDNGSGSDSGGRTDDSGSGTNSCPEDCIYGLVIPPHCKNPCYAKNIIDSDNRSSGEAEDQTSSAGGRNYCPPCPRDLTVIIAVILMCPPCSNDQQILLESRIDENYHNGTSDIVVPGNLNRRFPGSIDRRSINTNDIQQDFKQPMKTHFHDANWFSEQNNSE